jgi:ribonucleoside-diphosphate reductase alpha chain
MDGVRLIETNSEFKKMTKKSRVYSQKLLNEIVKSGTIQKIPNIPKKIKKTFVTALDISPAVHIKMQAAFQKYTDNAVSKTVNLPKNASIEDVKKAYLLAYRLRSKGVTVYRYGSKSDQVLTIETPRGSERQIVADSEFGGGCEGIICTH